MCVSTLFPSELFNSSPPHGLQTWTSASSDHLVSSAHNTRHMLLDTNSLDSVVAQRSCNDSFSHWMSCPPKNGQIFGFMQSYCTCRLFWIVLPLHHFVPAVHHFYSSSSADSSMGSCGTLYKRFSACCLAPLCPLSALLCQTVFLVMGQLRTYTILVVVGAWLSTYIRHKASHPSLCPLFISPQWVEFCNALGL